MTIFLILIASFAMAVLFFVYQLPRLREWNNRRQTNSAMEFLLESSDYYLMKDVVLLTFEGLIQIDLIIVSRFGVFVVATYQYSGMIDGTDVGDTWTQISKDKERHEFQNPSYQNRKNTDTLKSLIDIDKNKIFPVVVFDAISAFKHTMMARTTRGGDFLHYIRSKQELLLTTKEIKNIVETIGAKRKKQGLVSGLKNIDTHNQTSSLLDNYQTCPTCGSEMVIRVEKNGRHVGRQFLRCVLYPTCRSTRSK